MLLKEGSQKLFEGWDDEKSGGGVCGVSLKKEVKSGFSENIMSPMELL